MNEYEKQAKEFLTECEATMTMVPETEPKMPIWGKDEKHACYLVTIKTPRGAYSFNFWDSIHNTKILEAVQNLSSKIGGIASQSTFWKHARIIEEYIKAETGEKKMINTEFEARAAALRLNDKIEKLYPSAYSVLACLSGYYPETFEDFCSEFGYDTDSIKAKETFEAVQKEELGLRRIFTTDQLEKLAEIN